MAITYNDSKDLGVDCRVGVGIACKVRVYVYGEDGHVIPGDFPDTSAMFKFWVDDDDEPEYILSAKLLSKNKKLKIVHRYIPAQIGSGTFSALNLFLQDEKNPQADMIAPIELSHGDFLDHPIRLEAK